MDSKTRRSGPCALLLELTRRQHASLTTRLITWLLKHRPWTKHLASSPPARRFTNVHCESISESAQSSQSTSQTCPTCSQSCPRIYSEGWICLNHLCTQYWLLSFCEGLWPIPPGFNLSYNPQWLTSIPTPTYIKPAYSVVPPAPVDTTSMAETCPGDRTLWRGWVCETCGRANCRFRWEVWVSASVDFTDHRNVEDVGRHLEGLILRIPSCQTGSYRNCPFWATSSWTHPRVSDRKSDEWIMAWRWFILCPGGERPQKDD